MAKYKVGDRVRVKTGIEFGKEFGPNYLWCPSSMSKYEGKILTVASVCHNGNDDWFKCREDVWIWCEELVTPVYQKTVSLTDKEIENIKASSNAFFDLL